MHVLSLASVALAVAASVSAMMIPHRHNLVTRHEKPATYYEGYLENYDVYHARYLALDCEAKHNTSFFDKCCHPMLATETLAKNRAPECNPANQVTSTASSAAASQTDDGGSDCEDEDPTPATSSAAPTATGDDGDDSDCDGDEPTSTVAHTSTRAASSTHSSSTHSETPKTTQTPTTTHSSMSTTYSTTAHTAKPSSTKTTVPAATSTAASSGDFTGGHATFFWQGGQAGACGAVHSDNSFIAALQTKRYGDLSQQSSNCGRKITLTNTNNGKTVSVTVADACPTCGNQNDLDLSHEAFLQIATEEEGDVPIVWHFDD